MGNVEYCMHNTDTTDSGGVLRLRYNTTKRYSRDEITIHIHLLRRNIMHIITDWIKDGRFIKGVSRHYYYELKGGERGRGYGKGIYIGKGMIIMRSFYSIRNWHQ